MTFWKRLMLPRMEIPSLFFPIFMVPIGLSSKWNKLSSNAQSCFMSGRFLKVKVVEV